MAGSRETYGHDGRLVHISVRRLLPGLIFATNGGVGFQRQHRNISFGVSLPRDSGIRIDLVETCPGA